MSKESETEALKPSDGSTANYYELPNGATQLQELISYRNMNAQLGEIFRAAYRYGYCSHSSQIREAKKIKFYAEAEIARLEKLPKYPDSRYPDSSYPDSKERGENGDGQNNEGDVICN